MSRYRKPEGLFVNALDRANTDRGPDVRAKPNSAICPASGCSILIVSDLHAHAQT